MLRRDLIKKLEAAGYRFVHDGDHTNMIKKGVMPPQRALIQVPRHRQIVDVLANKILKDAGLK